MPQHIIPPIQFPTYRPLEAAEVSPGAGVLSSMLSNTATLKDLQKQQMQNEILKAQAAAAPQMSQEELLKAHLGNVLQQQSVDFNPQMNQQKLMQMQLANQMQGQNIDTNPAMNQAKLDLLRAHASYFQNRGMIGGEGGPLSNAGKTISDLAHIKSQYGEDSPEYKLASSIANGQSQKNNNVIANLYRSLPPQGKDQILNQYQNSGFTTSQALNMISKGIPPDSPEAQGALNQPQSQPAPSAQEAPSVKIPWLPQPLGQQSSQVAPNTPVNNEIATKQAGETQSSIDKRSLPNASLKALAAGDKFNSEVEELPAILDEALKYRGILGTLKGKVSEKLIGVTGKSPPQLVALDNLNKKLSQMEQDSGTALGIRATDKGYEQHHRIFDINKVFTNPDFFKAQLSNTIDTVQKGLESNYRNVAQLGSRVQNQKNPLASPSSGKMEVPNFNSKQEYHDWYGRLSPAQQQQADAKMFGKGG